jgi:GTP-binding protein Era
MPTTEKTRSGFVALLGRPNVGKSTLLNAILGQKLSITCAKPQTTRHKILGIKTLDQQQMIFVDTPGIHQHLGTELNKRMNRQALSTLNDVDILIMVIDGLVFREQDEWIYAQLCKVNKPKILVINKVDLISDKDTLLEFLAQLAQRGFDAWIPLSAQKKQNIEGLLKEVAQRLPEGPFYFPVEAYTDRQLPFLLAEALREAVMKNAGQEVPYQSAIMIDELKLEEGLARVHASIWVERPGQKQILIGKAGERLKKIGTQARKDMERILKRKVFLQTWVRVKESWSDSQTHLDQLGL